MTMAKFLEIYGTHVPVLLIKNVVESADVSVEQKQAILTMADDLREALMDAAK